MPDVDENNKEKVTKDASLSAQEEVVEPAPMNDQEGNGPSVSLTGPGEAGVEGPVSGNGPKSNPGEANNAATSVYPDILYITQDGRSYQVFDKKTDGSHEVKKVGDCWKYTEPSPAAIKSGGKTKKRRNTKKRINGKGKGKKRTGVKSRKY